jgi:hypothetical protein
VNPHATIAIQKIPRKIPRKIPQTNPTPPDESDTTGQVFFQIRMIPTPPDESDRLQPPHNPLVAGSIPAGPTTKRLFRDASLTPNIFSQQARPKMGKAQVTSGEQESVEKERAKRIRVERNIYKRTDMGAETYEVRAYVARKANGSPHHEYRYITGTLSDARDALTTLKAEVIAGKYRVPVVEPSGTDVANEEPRLDEWDDLTKVNDAIEGWRLNGWQDLSPSTTRRYISIFQVHVKDTIGKDRVSELTPLQSRDLLPRSQGQGPFAVERAPDPSAAAQGLLSR